MTMKLIALIHSNKFVSHLLYWTRDFVGIGSRRVGLA